MTQRERHTPGEAPSRDATGKPAARPAAASSAGPVPPPPSDASVWAEWYQRASPAQQQEALARAVSQGILYAHELAAPAHSAAPPRSLLATLLSGQIKELPPLEPLALNYHDGELDATQRDAVAHAVATPDVCMIQGFPGTGKSRVVAEIILQEAQRGERILFLASTPAALDRVLGRLGTHPALCPLRCRAADENEASLPPDIARLTLPDRVRCYRDSTVPAARAACDAARQALDARRRHQPPWTQLEELARRADDCTGRMRQLTERRAGVAAEVERLDETAGSFRDHWEACGRLHRETLEQLDGRLAGLRAERDTIVGKQGHLEQEWEQVRPLAEARQGRRFWTAAWWGSWLRGGLAERLRDLETRRAELLTARQRLEQNIDACQTERAAVEARHVEECRRLKEEEIARRQSELDAEMAAVSREQDALRQKWQELRSAFPADLLPAEMSGAALTTARAEWEQQQARAEQIAASAEQWLQAVEQGLPHLPEKLAACANVVAATTTALPADVHFGDRNGKPAVLFDLLILDEAHLVTESEFAAAARRARRWVLVGEPQSDDEPAPAGRKLVRAAVPRPGFFQRLWRNLHADPHGLPFAWTQNDGRLVCRLRPIPAGLEAGIETEPVADQPDIELRILSVARQTPQVAEVAFPPCMGIAEAKQFIYRELGELAVHTHGRTMRWTETDEDVSLQFSPDLDGNSVTVVLEEGVRESVGRGSSAARDGATWHTRHLCFARAAGWNRERAEQWIAERLDLRSLGRTALLTVPHRLDASLARFVSDLLFGGICEPAAGAADAAFARAAVEFVAVPSLSAGEGRSRAEPEGRWNGGDAVHGYGGERHPSAATIRAPRMRSVKGGAGLELDLADDRPLEQLPLDLRARLPRAGLVNYLEARALVKRLESLLRDGAFCAACARWQSKSSENGPPREHREGPAVAVMALYPAQVELLRQLIRQTDGLTQSQVSIEIGLPSAFGQRECLLGLVSLTRSHTHRAVSYGEHPHHLAQALTRAASGLILFGDPGTLARRSQWHGALDHLDEPSARREARLIGQLVQYLQGHGPHPSAFHVQEGSGV